MAPQRRTSSSKEKERASEREKIKGEKRKDARKKELRGVKKGAVRGKKTSGSPRARAAALGAKKLRVHFRRPRGAAAAAVESRDKGCLIQGPTHTYSGPRMREPSPGSPLSLVLSRNSLRRPSILLHALLSSFGLHVRERLCIYARVTHEPFRSTCCLPSPLYGYRKTQLRPTFKALRPGLFPQTFPRSSCPRRLLLLPGRISGKPLTA